MDSKESKSNGAAADAMSGKILAKDHFLGDLYCVVPTDFACKCMSRHDAALFAAAAQGGPQHQQSSFMASGSSHKCLACAKTMTVSRINDMYHAKCNVPLSDGRALVHFTWLKFCSVDCRRTWHNRLSKLDAALANTYVECCAACKTSTYERPLLDVCTRCRQVVYCSQKCQQAAWREHKKSCRAQQ